MGLVGTAPRAPRGDEAVNPLFWGQEGEKAKECSHGVAGPSEGRLTVACVVEYETPRARLHLGNKCEEQSSRKEEKSRQ